MRFDHKREFYIPQGAREERDEEAGAVAYLYENARGKPCALGFAGKAQKPTFHFSYSSEERRAAAIAQFFAGRRASAAYKAERAAERRTDAAKRSALDFSGKDYLSDADTAALCRAALKETFPGTRFSVTSDRSLNVRWTDGPSNAAIKAIVDTFAGSYFDGMIDYQGSIYHELDGRRVHFGASFVFTHREMSAEALEVGRAAYEAAGPGRAGAVRIEAGGGYDGRPAVHVAADHAAVCPNRYHEPTIQEPEGCFGTRFSSAAAHALELWHDQARPVAPLPSPTMGRIRVLGSDGYGVGGGEAEDGGEGMRGYPREKEPETTEPARQAIAEAERQTAEILAGVGFGSAPERPSAVIIPFPVGHRAGGSN